MAWASAGRAVDWQSLASEGAARKPQLRAPCSFAMAMARWKASSAGAGLERPMAQAARIGEQGARHRLELAVKDEVAFWKRLEERGEDVA